MAQPASIKPTTQGCPSFDSLFDFNVGRVTAEELETIGSHLEACETCRKTVEAICHQPDALVSEIRDDETHNGEAGNETPQVEEIVRAIQRVAHEPGACAEDSSLGNLKTLREYELLDKLGQGGMGAVYKARHLRLDKTVAVKLLAREKLSSEQAVERFDREMKAIGALDHPNIVRALDAGEVEGTHFLAMEYVDGTNLSKLVRERGALRIEEACEYIRQAATGLQHIHDSGLIHRDIKPSNLIVSGKWNDDQCAATVKILDLGLALLGDNGKDKTASDDHDLTQADQLIGTFDYIAPEQAKKAHEVDSRADIYGLGCTLYCLLAGRAPFSDHSVVEKLTAHQLESPKSLSRLRDDLPPELISIVSKMCAKSPDDRFQTPLEVANALQGVLLTRSESGPRAATGKSATQRRRVFAGTALLLALSVFGFFFGGTVVRIATNKGQLVIATQAEDVEVVVKDQVGKIIDRRTGREITLAAGDYEIDVTIKDTDGETRFFTKELSLKRGDREIVRAQLEIADQQPGSESAPHEGNRTNLAEVTPGVSDLVFPPIPDAERFSWQPEELVAVLGEHHGRQWGPIECVAVSPDESLIVTGGQDQSVRLWDRETLREVEVLDGHTHNVNAVAFAPKSGLLVSGGNDRTLRGWVMNGPTKPAFAVSTSGRPGCIAFSADGTRLACGHTRSNIVTLWLVTATGMERLDEVTTADNVNDVEFSRDADRLFAGQSDGAITVYDTANDNLTELMLLQGHTKRVSSLAVSPDGQFLASGSYDTTVRVWDVTDTDSKPRILRHAEDGELLSLAFSPDGQTLAAGVWDAKNLYLWDLSQPEPLPQVAAIGGNNISALTFVNNGRTLVTTGGTGAIQMLDLASEGTTKQIEVHSHQGPVSSLVFSPDGKTLYSSGRDGWVCVWQFASESGNLPRRFFNTGLNATFATALLSDGQTLAVAGSGRGVPIMMGDPTLDEWTPSRITSGHDASIEQLAVSADGKWLASSSQSSSRQTGEVRLFRMDRRAPQLWSTIGADQPSDRLKTRHPAFSPDSQFLGTLHGEKVQLWKLSDSDHPELIRELQHQSEVVAVEFSPDGKQLVTGCRNRTAHLWQLSGDPPDLLHSFDPKPARNSSSKLTQDEPVRLVFSPKGQTIAVAVNGHVYLWQPESFEESRSWRFPGEVHSLCFAPNGRHLLTGNANGTIYVLNSGVR